MILCWIEGISADCVRAELLEIGNVSSAALDITQRVDIAILYGTGVSEVRVSGDAMLTVPAGVVPLLDMPD
jgi:hypothetical protein